MSTVTNQQPRAHARVTTAAHIAAALARAVGLRGLGLRSHSVHTQ